jgi:hypothetical protein
MSNVNLSVFEFQIQTGILKNGNSLTYHQKICRQATANLLPVKFVGRYEAKYQFINVN